MRLVLILSCLFTLVGCGRLGNNKVEATHALLIEGFESYTSVAEVKAGMLARLPWKVETEARLSPDDPPWFLCLSVQSFSHLGHPGELYVVFLNDRLMETVFFPVDSKAYLQ